MLGKSFILLAVCLAAAQLTQLSAYQCVHDKRASGAAAHMPRTDLNSVRNLQSGPASYAPIRITFDYASLRNLDPSLTEYI